MWIKWDKLKKDNIIVILESIQRSFLDETFNLIIKQKQKQKQKYNTINYNDCNIMEDEKISEISNINSINNNNNINIFQLWGSSDNYKYKNKNTQMLQLDLEDIQKINGKCCKQNVCFIGVNDLLHKYQHWYIFLHKAIDSMTKHLPIVLINIKFTKNKNQIKKYPKISLVSIYYDCCLYFRNGNIIMFFKQLKSHPKQHQSYVIYI